MPDSESHNTGWRLNKEIPVGMIATIAIQTVFVIVFITKMDGRIERLEEKRSEDKIATAQLLVMPDRLTRNEYETAGLKEGFKRLELKIDQLSLEAARRVPAP